MKELNYILDFFPVVELPVTITEESIHAFSKENKPLPGALVHFILDQWEGDEEVEFTEIVPCLQLPEHEEFFGIIYLKIDLLSHEFVLATLNKRTLALINKKVVAGVISNGQDIIRSAATIDSDLMINVMVGQSAQGSAYDPMSAEAFYIEVLPGGNIYSQKEDEAISWLKEKNIKRP